MDELPTVWEQAFDFLDSEGFDVYSPGTHEGDCTSPYLVVQRSGSNRHMSFSTDIDYYDVLVYVPKLQYSKVDRIVGEVKAAMTALEPMILPAGSEQPVVYNDDVKAHMTSVMYKNYKYMRTKIRQGGQ